ncbi:hypothetical protein [Actinacidiphila oryziradicis]|uniref:Uncharacterized protein n=1 Tax=Actinacidiphila oryziradicis TaxID=2571141 RepID=A0A4V5N391_9ACTN|nr:hypothetical protein [Actinacidiphila oryziradicis]TKA13059.1 hypothetical protein FCI23_03480 [Actinacidiphila oryziradicis]
MADAAARRGIPMEARPADCAGWASLREGVFVMPPATPTRRHGASSALRDSARRAHGHPGGPALPYPRTLPPSPASAAAELEAALDRVSPGLTLLTPFKATALDALLADWSANAQAHTGAEPHPIRDLVAIQTEAALRAAALNR